MPMNKQTPHQRISSSQTKHPNTQTQHPTNPTAISALMYNGIVVEQLVRTAAIRCGYDGVFSPEPEPELLAGADFWAIRLTQ